MQNFLSTTQHFYISTNLKHLPIVTIRIVRDFLASATASDKMEIKR
jgi:hypothetical protein